MKKIVIIGAGPAGITAAYELLKNNEYELIILEKEDTIGGISKTVSINGMYSVDTGIHRFYSKNDKINEIWNEVLPLQSKPAYEDIKTGREIEYIENGSDPEKDEKSMLIKDRCTRIYYKNNFFDYPVNLKFENIRKLGFFTIVKAGFSYIKAKIFKKKEDSLENFYINRFGKVLYSIFFESYTEKVWGIHPSKISADWGAQRVKGVSITAIIKDAIQKLFKIKSKDTETSLIDRFTYPKLGAGQMWDEMAKVIKEKGGIIITNAETVGIVADKKKITGVEYLKDGKIITEKADIVISSMPIKELISSIKNTEVPNDIYDIAINLPYRDFMSVCMVVDKIKLKNETKRRTIGNFVPDHWIYIQYPNVKLGRIQIFNNWSSYLFKNREDVENKVLITFEYFCNENDEYWNMSDEDFINFVKSEAIKIDVMEEQEILAAKRIKIKKAYPAYWGTYKDFDKVVNYINSYENLYCVGRNGQHRYNNMDHSMLTGVEVANNIINNIEDRKNIWNINTEKEYHETKKNRENVCRSKIKKRF